MRVPLGGRPELGGVGITLREEFVAVNSTSLGVGQ